MEIEDNEIIEALRARIQVLEAERAAYMGRRTPPTDAEIDFHAARGGVWLIQGLYDKLPRFRADRRTLKAIAQVHREMHKEWLWLPWLKGRVLPWPE